MKPRIKIKVWFNRARLLSYKMTSDSDSDEIIESSEDSPVQKSEEIKVNDTESYAIIFLYTSDVPDSEKLAAAIDKDCSLRSTITTISVDSKEIREIIPGDIVKTVPVFIVKKGDRLKVYDIIDRTNIKLVLETAKDLTKLYGSDCETKES